MATITIHQNVEEHDFTDSNGRYGTIYFRKRNFWKCEYSGLQQPYDYQDWQFLTELGQVINDLQQKYDRKEINVNKRDS